MLKFKIILNNHSQRILLSISAGKLALLVALGQVFLPLLQGGEDSALSNLASFASDSNRVVLGVTGLSGKPNPERWLVFCQAKADSDDCSEYVVEKGSVIAERKVSTATFITRKSNGDG